MVLRFEIAFFGTHGGVRDLGQRGIDMAIGGGSFAAAPFASAFTIAGTLTCPGSKVFVGRESSHVSSGFRDGGDCVTLVSVRPLGD